jgi:subtilisin family serine protease
MKELNMKKNQGRLKFNLWQMLISGLLIINLLLPGLPTKVSAQAADDDLKMSGEKVNVAAGVSKTASKMAIKKFSSNGNRAQNTSGVAKSKANEGEKFYVAINVEFNSAASRKTVFSDAKVSKIKNAFVITAFDRFADIYVTAIPVGDDFKLSPDAEAALKANPNIVRTESEGLVSAPPPPKTNIGPTSGAIPEPIVRGGYQKNGMNLTGKNTIIAILDTGIDFRHPDFITYDAQGRPTSRIAYLWDTSIEFQPGRGSTSPVKYPNGTSVGTLFTREQLTNELRAANPTIPATDLDGHGTACGSVAAGNGNADKRTGGLKRKEVEGVAPEADIIGIRQGKTGFENTYLLNAMVEWLEKVAGKTPLVISGSFGGHYTGHDGQSIQERHLNARFPLTKPGRALVFAAGNEGFQGIHAKANFTKEPKLVSWTANSPTLLRLYFNSSDKNIVINGSKATPIGPQNMWREINPLTKQLSAEIFVPAGRGGIWLQNTAGVATEAHLYFYSSESAEFSPESVSYTHLVGAPGNTENAITVGSFDWNDNFHEGGRIQNPLGWCGRVKGEIPLTIGHLSCYSSPGPNRTGVVKPEIVAPGQWYSSANAKDRGATVAWGEPDSTGMYRKMNGTSAATPYVSGIIALMFQKKPTLTLGEVRSHLKGKAAKSGLNPFREAIPNSEWGFGKLNMDAIDKIFAAL